MRVDVTMGPTWRRAGPRWECLGTRVGGGELHPDVSLGGDRWWCQGAAARMLSPVRRLVRMHLGATKHISQL